jgi:hypothetical protein
VLLGSLNHYARGPFVKSELNCFLERHKRVVCHFIKNIEKKQRFRNQQGFNLNTPLTHSKLGTVKKEPREQEMKLSSTSLTPQKTLIYHRLKKNLSVRLRSLKNTSVPMFPHLPGYEDMRPQLLLYIIDSHLPSCIEPGACNLSYPNTVICIREYPRSIGI